MRIHTLGKMYRERMIRLNNKKTAISIGIVCLLLCVGIVVQIRTTKGTNQVVSESLEGNDLRDQVLKWKEKYDETTASLNNAEKALSKIREEATKNTEGSSEKQEEIKNNNILLGLTDVEGEGVIISLKDNNTVTADSLASTDDITYYLVHDSDLRNLVNELENSGAEAISINDERIVSTTSITCEGTVININGNKVSSPFTIEAIGPGFKMYSALKRPGGYVEKLNSTGITTTVKQAEKVKISKFAGIISSKVMKYSE